VIQAGTGGEGGRMHYCDYACGDALHGPYHDTEHGFPVRDETVLFERLILEISQAGLSWGTVLRKRDSLRAGYAGFEVDRVAAFDDRDRDRLLADPGVIRNRRKVEAAIYNARVVRALRDRHGGFAAWLDAQHPQTRAQWTKTMKSAFVLVGGEITNEFLMSVGYLPGAHKPDCPVYERVLAAAPPWTQVPAAHFGA
jgi:DNA-3-methyladenine glycosylase I